MLIKQMYIVNNVNDGSSISLSGHTDSVLFVEWIDPNLFVSGSKDNTLRLWIKSDDQWISARVINAHDEKITSLNVNLDHNIISIISSLFIPLLVLLNLKKNSYNIK